MIHKLNLKSYKCFQELDLLFAPLTVLTGRNSSGKSTVLQSLLMLKKGNILEGHGGTSDLRCATGSGWPEITLSWGDAHEIYMKINEKTVLSPNNNTLMEMDYISADRFGPRITLPYKEDVSGVGEHGEYVYALLSAYRDQGGVPEVMRHPMAKDASGIFEQTRAWLDLVAPGEKFDFQAYKNADVAVGAFSEYRPTNVGFGLSYTLPVIVSLLVMSAAKAKGEMRQPILLLENPEAHLHPAGQTTLGVFFALAAASGVQCIVETHSEHIINGIRVAIKEKKITPNDVIFHFFTKDKASEESEALAIFADQHGMLDKWPEGFFDESEKTLMRLF